MRPRRGRIVTERNATHEKRIRAGRALRMDVATGAPVYQDRRISPSSF